MKNTHLLKNFFITFCLFMPLGANNLAVEQIDTIEEAIAEPILTALEEEIIIEPSPPSDCKDELSKLSDFESYLSSHHLQTQSLSASKVRLRLKPDLDAHIVHTLEKGDLLITGKATKQFSSVVPPSQDKAYIYRAFVIDNRVEGNRVNVRLAPDLQSPVIAQLNQGDIVQGQISPQSRKWLEIDMPESVRYYIFSDYLEPIAPSQYLQEIASNTSIENSKKSAPEEELSDFIPMPSSNAPSLIQEETPTGEKTFEEIEEEFFQSYLQEHPDHSEDDYRLALSSQSVSLKGYLLPYEEEVSGAPGNYIFHDGPRCYFIYSTTLPLDKYCNQALCIKVVRRDNLDFAWPAYYLIDLESDSSDSY